MNLLRIATQLTGIAKTLAPAIIPGAGPAIAAAQGIITLGKELLGHVGALPEGQELKETLDDLEARVVAHADRVEQELGDGPAA
jgi:hypothetical protein